MGRRRYGYGQTADIDDPGRQGMRFGFFIPGFPVLHVSVNDAVMPSVMIVTPCGADMPFVMAMIMSMDLVIVDPMMAVPFLIVFSLAASPMGHGRSTEKHHDYG